MGEKGWDRVRYEERIEEGKWCEKKNLYKAFGTYVPYKTWSST